MSAHARFSSHARKTTDHAVSRAYACLAGEERASFTALLDAVRTRTAVRSVSARRGGLRNVARFVPRYVRPLAAWKGGGGAIYPVVHALVQHLLAVHEVPRFLRVGLVRRREHGAPTQAPLVHFPRRGDALSRSAPAAVDDALGWNPSSCAHRMI